VADDGDAVNVPIPSPVVASYVKTAQGIFAGGSSSGSNAALREMLPETATTHSSRLAGGPTSGFSLPGRSTVDWSLPQALMKAEMIWSVLSLLASRVMTPDADCLAAASASLLENFGTRAVGVAREGLETTATRLAVGDLLITMAEARAAPITTIPVRTANDRNRELHTMSETALLRRADSNRIALLPCAKRSAPSPEAPALMDVSCWESRDGWCRRVASPGGDLKRHSPNTGPGECPLLALERARPVLRLALADGALRGRRGWTQLSRGSLRGSLAPATPQPGKSGIVESRPPRRSGPTCGNRSVTDLGGGGIGWPSGSQRAATGPRKISPQVMP